jgi:hypothetical protein
MAQFHGSTRSMAWPRLQGRGPTPLHTTPLRPYLRLAANAISSLKAAGYHETHTCAAAGIGLVIRGPAPVRRGVREREWPRGRAAGAALGQNGARAAGQTGQGGWPLLGAASGGQHGSEEGASSRRPNWGARAGSQQPWGSGAAQPRHWQGRGAWRPPQSAVGGQKDGVGGAPPGPRGVSVGCAAGALGCEGSSACAPDAASGRGRGGPAEPPRVGCRGRGQGGERDVLARKQQTNVRACGLDGTLCKAVRRQASGGPAAAPARRDCPMSIGVKEGRAPKCMQRRLRGSGQVQAQLAPRRATQNI